MIVMPTNNTGRVIRELAVEFPGQLAHLMSVDGWRTPFLSYALDNGAFAAWSKGERWMQREFIGLCDKAQQCATPPLWVVVPDVVTNREQTIWNWGAWEAKLRRFYGWPLAFAVQDGMTSTDVPKDADVVFVGGSTEFKWSTLEMWCKEFPRVHVGRVNTYRLLWKATEAGAESCDGTGWMRGDQKQFRGLKQFLKEWQSGHRAHPQQKLGVH